MANDLATANPATACLMPALTPNMQTVLSKARDVDASFSDADIALIAPIAAAVPVPLVASERTIRQSIGALAAALPSQTIDEAAGKLKLNAYLAMLAGCDERALSYACRRCLDDLDWMPTIHQLKDRMARWVNPEQSAVNSAKLILRSGRRATKTSVADADPLQPEQVKRTNAYLRTIGVATQFAEDGSTFQAEAA